MRIKNSVSGFALTELIVGILVMGIAFATFLTIHAQQRARIISVEAMLRGTEIANSLMGIIRAHNFDENTVPPWSGTLGPEESSAGFYDDVDDYQAHDWSTELAGMPGYTATSRVFYVNPNNNWLDSVGTATDFKRLIISVNHAALKSPIVLSSLITPRIETGGSSDTTGTPPGGGNGGGGDEDNEDEHEEEGDNGDHGGSGEVGGNEDDGDSSGDEGNNGGNGDEINEDEGGGNSGSEEDNGDNGDSESGSEECNECDGKVTSLMLEYKGSGTAVVKVKQKDGETVFNSIVSNGEQFFISGTDKNGTLGTEITIYVNGDEATRIHTSCSQPIGPGTVSGDFEVISGTSRNGGALCAQSGNSNDQGDSEDEQKQEDDGDKNGGDQKKDEQDDQGDEKSSKDGHKDKDKNKESCEECDGGITELTLQYNGDKAAWIRVKQGKKSLYYAMVSPSHDNEFTFSGNNSDGTMGKKIKIFVKGKKKAEIETDCSETIGPGSKFGDFEVVSGKSKRGGELCPAGKK
jgi:type II secretory pathway pseudopilin PulG